MSSNDVLTMFSPSSPFMSSMSATSSTLVVTPYPYPKVSEVIVPKGYLQPHVSNLPRRKPRTKPVLALPAPPSSYDEPTTAVISHTTRTPVAITAPAIPTREIKGPIGPHVSNLPRRPHTTSDSRRRRRLERQCRLQELIPSSSVWICFSTPDDDDDHANEFSFVIRIVESTDRACLKEGNTLVLGVPTCLDSGSSNLNRRQLLAAWTHCSDSGSVLVVTTTERAVDAVAIAVGLLAGTEEEVDVLQILARIHDFEEELVDDVWRGVLSAEGVRWLEKSLAAYRSY